MLEEQLTKIALIVQYQGTAYHGWQYQNPETPTVQMILENALSRIAGDAPVSVVCAGRTDTGVHASYQVVHFTSPVDRENKAWREGTNTLLPDDVSVVWADEVSDEFHARFSAKSRQYRYFIWNHRERSAWSHQHMSWHRYPLDEKLMHQAAQSLLGEQDFQSFRGAGCQSNTPYRCVHKIEVSRQGDVVQIDIEANAFLLHMVRNIVGTLLPVGEGEKPIHWVSEVLESKDRRAAGITAPAKGLHLINVSYDKAFALPSVAAPFFSFS